MTAHAIQIPAITGPSRRSLRDEASPAVGANRANVSRAAAALRSWLGSSRVGLVARRVNMPARVEMPADAQWRKVSTIIELAIRRGQTAAELHAAAALRIDSTEYEIGLLKHDLAGILGGALPGVRAVCTTRPSGTGVPAMPGADGVARFRVG